MTESRGRPSIYRPILNHIREISGHEWHIVRRGHANRTAPSGLRARYEGFDFRAAPDGHGKFNIEARVLDSVTTASGEGDRG